MVTPSDSPFHLLSCLVVLLLLSLLSFAFDPNPLQDFCVADMSAPPLLNGFPCLALQVIFSERGNSLHEIIMTPPRCVNTANTFSVNLIAGNILSFLGLNTLGISMNRVDFARGGINPPHSHPRASETDYVAENPNIITGCEHHFHLSCILEWMERSDACPICDQMEVHLLFATKASQPGGIDVEQFFVLSVVIWQWPLDYFYLGESNIEK
ncbi:Germin-like protein subfamily T member 2 [Morella rubra]|uniref:Germin-like protein subfamily T member 2 n=1 Tax=Morella rubra TaxID=262757 RepID=A0A6A1W302_9ROSI|nr:Germin-like protein subfamily T member 2 [Morella rubra]